jgi:hypothetical protein
MGILALDHSQGKVLTILSLTELDPTLVREKSKKGVNPVRLRVIHELYFWSRPQISGAGPRRE